MTLSDITSECQIAWIQIQDRSTVGPDLGPNTLQRFSTEEKRRRFEEKLIIEFCVSMALLDSSSDQAIRTAAANSAKFRGIRPGKYIEDLL